MTSRKLPNLTRVYPRQSANTPGGLSPLPVSLDPPPVLAHRPARALAELVREIERLQAENRLLGQVIADTLTAAADYVERFQLAQKQKRSYRLALVEQEANYNALIAERNEWQRQTLLAQLPADDLRAGLDAIRAVLDEVYPTRQPLSLVKKIEGLAKDRDIWQRRALAAENANRAESRHATYADQRKPS